jgi:hypothetical protein
MVIKKAELAKIASSAGAMVRGVELPIDPFSTDIGTASIGL